MAEKDKEILWLCKQVRMSTVGLLLPTTNVWFLGVHLSSTTG